MLLLLYRGTGLAMVEIWSRSDTFAHAFLVPPIVIWMIWRKRDLLAQLQPRPVPWMLPVMGALAALWWVGELASVNSASQLAFTAMFVVAVPLVLGWQVANALLFPLAFLFFAVPIGDFLTPTLMDYTADFTIEALRQSGVPVYREGLQFVIPSGNWSVVEACSGVRYLVASFMVGSLFAYLNYRSARRRWIFVAFSLIVPIVANWFRAYMIVMLGHLSGNKIATGVDHVIYGWVFFGIVITALFFIGSRWAEAPVDTATVLKVPARARASSKPSNGPRMRRETAAVAALAALVLALPHLPVREAAGLATAPVGELPDRLSPTWQADPRTLTDWRPVFVGSPTSVERLYAAGDRLIGVQTVSYRDTAGQRKLISSVNVLVASNDRRWNQVATGARTVPSADGDSRWRTADLIGADRGTGLPPQRLTVWHSHWVDGRFVANDALAKILHAWLRVRGRSDDSVTVILVADAPKAQEADEVLRSFVAANLLSLRAALMRSRSLP
ncbi:MAG: exosortase A [Rhizobacter sp.]|nr:exosortase A [Rhizobacter sp.]